MEFIIGIAIALFISFFTYLKKSLTPGASITVFILMLAMLFSDKIRAILLLIIAYLLVIIIDKVFEKGIKEAVIDVHNKTGTRDFIQVLANGLLGTISIVLYKLTHNYVFLFGFIIGIGEALADSIASDVGVLSKNPPVDICTLKPITKGMSGGISALGLISSFIFCIIYVVFAFFLFRLSFENCVLITVISFSGCIIDSLLGSRIQSKYICNVCGKHTEKNFHCGRETQFAGGVKFIDNCAVNLISNFLTIIIGLTVFYLFNGR